MIRVLIVEDSPLMAKMIAAILSTDPGILVAGIAKSGEEAVRFTPQLKPDVITMDIHLPGMDGLEATKQIMAYSPTPILILSSSVLRAKSEKVVFEAMTYGAMDILDKQIFEGDEIDETAKASLIDRIHLLSHVSVISHPLARFESRKKQVPALPGVREEEAQGKVVGIAASTGGPQALMGIFKALPKDFPVPIVVVLHISPGFIEGFVEWLDQNSNLHAKVAENDEVLKPGTVYMAPTERQMRVNQSGKIELRNAPPVGGHCPSGTVLLESLALSFGREGLGIVLTGMGRDGAEGLKSVRRAKGHTIAQDEKSSMIFGMPKAAIELDAADEIVPLNEIADRIMSWVAG